MVNKLVFGGISSEDYEAHVDVYETFTAPERDVTTVSVPGRNGDLVIDNGRYLDAEIKYTLFFTDANKLEWYRNAMLNLVGYHRLEDSRHPEEYRVARISGGITPTMAGYKSSRGMIELTFVCKPQRFLKSGERPIELTKAAKVLNPSRMTAKPLIRVYGAGQLGVGDCTVTIAEHSQAYMDIDSDLQECYYESTPLNDKATFAQHRFPELSAGETGITLGTGITKVILWPRWWKL